MMQNLNLIAWTAVAVTILLTIIFLWNITRKPKQKPLLKNINPINREAENMDILHGFIETYNCLEGFLTLLNKLPQTCTEIITERKRIMEQMRFLKSLIDIIIKIHPIHKEITLYQWNDYIIKARLIAEGKLTMSAIGPFTIPIPGMEEYISQSLKKAQESSRTSTRHDQKLKHHPFSK